MTDEIYVTYFQPCPFIFCALICREFKVELPPDVESHFFIEFRNPAKAKAALKMANSVTETVPNVSVSVAAKKQSGLNTFSVGNFGCLVGPMAWAHPILIGAPAPNFDSQLPKGHLECELCPVCHDHAPSF